MGGAGEIPTAQMTPSRIVELMRAGGGDAGVVEAGASALVALTGGKGRRAERVAALAAVGVDYEARCKECTDRGAAGVLVAALKAHGSLPAVVQYACGALRSLAAVPAGQIASLSAGAVPQIVAALRAHTREPAVVEWCCCALINFSNCSAGKEACLSEGAVPAIVDALQTFAGVPGVAEHACGALSNIANSDDFDLNASMSAAVVAALQANASEPVVVEAACLALSNFLAADEDASAPEGAVSAVVAALQDHGSVEGVVEYASRVLLGIFYQSGSAVDDIVEAGAVPLLAAAFAAHSGRASRSAHYALDGLGYTDEGVSKESLGLPTSSMPPARIVELMLGSGAGDGRMAEEACRALALVARDDEGSQACLDAGAVPAIVSVLRAHANEPAVALEACAALRCIAGSDGREQPCVDAGAVPAIVAALQTHASEPDLLERACAALNNITHAPAGADASVPCGAAPALVALLLIHSENAEVVGSACRALEGVASTPTGLEAVVAAGAVPALVAALHTHASEANTARLLCRALGSIISDSERADRAALASPGVRAAIVAVLQANASEAVVAEYACWALARIADIPGGQGDAVLAVAAALEAHARAAPVVIQACAALSAFATLPSSDPARRAIVEALPAVVAVLWAQATNPEAAAAALDTLTRISVLERAKEPRCLVLLTGAIPAIADVLQAHAATPAPAPTPQGSDSTPPAEEDPVVVAVQEACMALYHIGSAHPSTRGEMVAAGAPPLLAEAFSAHVGEAREKAHEALSMLGYSDYGLGRAAVEAISAGMTPERVVGLLSAGGGSPRVAAAGARALKDLAAAPEAGWQACMAAGALPVLLAALHTHASEEAVALSACQALLNLVGEGEAAGCSGGGGGGGGGGGRGGGGEEAMVSSSAAGGGGEGRVVAALVAVLKAQGPLASVAYSACEVLVKVISASARRQPAAAATAAVVAAGAVPVLADALFTHPTCSAAREALALLGCNDFGLGSAEVPEGALLQVGAAAGASPARAVELLRAGGGSAAVAEAGALALVALTGGTGKKADRLAVLRAVQVDYEARCEECVEAGAAWVLVAAMRTHASLPAVAEQACWALRNLSGINSGGDACASAGALPSLVAALTTHVGVVGVVHPACLAVGNISISPLGGESSVAAVPAVVAAVRANVSSDAVVEQGSWALGVIGGGAWSSNRLRPAILAAGAGPVLAAASRAQTGAARERALRTLSELGCSVDGFELPTTAMAPSRVMELMRAGGGDARVAEEGAKVLRQIATNTLEGGQRCIDAGAVPALVAALQTHGSVLAVAECACRALASIASTPAGQEACASGGAVPPIVAALSTHSTGSQDTAKHACMALGNIALNPAGSDTCVAEGAVPLIVLALRTYAREESVAQYACGALLNLTCFTPSAIPPCLAAGGEEALRAAEAANFSASPAACWALCNISPAACADSRIATAAASYITTLMTQGGESYCTVVRCLSLTKIAANETGRDCCIAAGAVPLLVAAFNACSGDARQQAHNALSALGRTDEGKE
jgi:hypothetical protein